VRIYLGQIFSQRYPLTDVFTPFWFTESKGEEEFQAEIAKQAALLLLITVNVMHVFTVISATPTQILSFPLSSLVKLQIALTLLVILSAAEREISPAP